MERVRSVTCSSAAEIVLLSTGGAWLLLGLGQKWRQKKKQKALCFKKCNRFSIAFPFMGESPNFPSLTTHA